MGEASTSKHLHRHVGGRLPRGQGCRREGGAQTERWRTEGLQARREAEAASWGEIERRRSRVLNEKGTRSDLWLRKVLPDSSMSLSGREGPTYISASSPSSARHRFSALAKSLNALCTSALPGLSPSILPSPRDSPLAPHSCSLLPSQNPRFSPTHPMGRATPNLLPRVANSRSTQRGRKNKTFAIGRP